MKNQDLTGNSHGRTMGCIRTFSMLASALFLAGLAHAQMAIQSLTAVTEGGLEVVRIQTTEPLKQLPAGFTIQSPARISLDFSGVTNATGGNLVELNRGNLRSANVVEAGDRTRVVLNLNQSVAYETRLDGNVLLVVLQPAVNATPAAGGMVGSAFSESTEALVQSLGDIDFRRGPDNAGRVIVDLPSNQTGVDIRQQGKNLVVEFMKTSLPEGLRRRLDVTDFGTPVNTITSTQVGDRVRLLVEPQGNWEHSAYQTDNQFVLEVRQVVKSDVGRPVSGPVYTGERLSLNFQNIEVRALLQVIADFTNFNIITSDTVTGNVTLRLKDVPWDQALDIILQSNGLAMRQNGNVIRIAPRAELEAEELQARENASKLQNLEPLRTQVYRLNFAKAPDIAKVLNEDRGTGGGSGSGSSSSENRLLSPRGSVVADERTNQIFVTDVSDRLAAVSDFVGRIDAPKRQVMIQARIVEATEGFGRSLGVRLGGADLRTIRGGTAGYGVGGNNRIAFGGGYNAITATTGATGITAANLGTVSAPFVNLPASTLRGSDASPATFALSLFNPSSNRFLNLELSALESDNRGRVVSSPKIVTGDLSKARIKQGDQLKLILPGGTDAAPKVETVDANLQLDVEPQITPSGQVLLKLSVTKNRVVSLSSAGATLSVKEAQTEVMVENGGTIMIGGIFEQDETTSTDKVPFLGDLPVLGHMFKNRVTNTSKTETLIFITPVIVDGRVELN